MGFAHLQVRGGHSYGFGTATSEEIVEAAARMGMGCLALTDRDGLYGVPRFLRAAEETDVSPVAGAEGDDGGRWAPGSTGGEHGRL